MGGGLPAARITDAHVRCPLQVRRLSGDERYKPYLQLRKVKDHFIFTIESTGAWRPHELFQHAVALMISKADKVLEGLQRFDTTSF